MSDRWDLLTMSIILTEAMALWVYLCVKAYQIMHFSHNEKSTKPEVHKENKETVSLRCRPSLGLELSAFLTPPRHGLSNLVSTSHTWSFKFN